MFKFLPDVALADIAFEAHGATAEEAIAEAGRALLDMLAEPATVKPKKKYPIALKAKSLDLLLYDFLSEIIYLKDTDAAVFHDLSLKVTAARRRSADLRKGSSGPFTLKATLRGEPIDRKRHELRNDAKAVTMHLFELTQLSAREWKAVVVIDI